MTNTAVFKEGRNVPICISPQNSLPIKNGIYAISACQRQLTYVCIYICIYIFALRNHITRIIKNNKCHIGPAK